MSWLRRLFRRRKRKPSGDWCATCLVDLDVGQVYEERTVLPNTGDEPGAGGSYLASTYCRKHAPDAAKRI